MQLAIFTTFYTLCELRLLYGRAHENASIRALWHTDQGHSRPLRGRYQHGPQMEARGNLPAACGTSPAHAEPRNLRSRLGWMDRKGRLSLLPRALGDPPRACALSAAHARPTEGIAGRGSHSEIALRPRQAADPRRTAQTGRRKLLAGLGHRTLRTRNELSAKNNLSVRCLADATHRLAAAKQGGVS